MAARMPRQFIDTTEEGITAVGWDETTGTLCVVTKDNILYMADFAYKGEYGMFLLFTFIFDRDCAF